VKNIVLEEVAQMLYDKAMIASQMEDTSITEPIKQRYREKYLTYCEAAENVRSMKEEE